MYYLSYVSANSFALYFFFFNDTATTEIYTLSLHDALPICDGNDGGRSGGARGGAALLGRRDLDAALGGAVLTPPQKRGDRKSTRLNSSHSQISYAVFCLKKKKKNIQMSPHTLYS